MKLEDIYTHEIAYLIHKCIHKNIPDHFFSFYLCQYTAQSHMIEAVSIEQT